jgi:hypothetical protein
MDNLTDEELYAERRRAELLGILADNAGEPDASNLHASSVRAIDVELRARKLIS